MTDLATIADPFVDMAHRIVWCTAATVDAKGNPRTRVLHPIWEFDGDHLTGWIATAPQSPKAAHLAVNPRVSLTYWAADHDTCTADCDTAWRNDPESKQTLWDRFVNAPQPVGYDPSFIPGWDDATSEGFGVLELRPTAIRLMPGSALLAGEGEVLSWRA